MSEKQDDGGPAFPVPGLQSDESFNGMSLRDYFASQVLPAYFSNGEDHGCFAPATEWAYRMADAMIKARRP